MLLNVSSDEKTLPTTYGELRPPLGKYRLKVGLVYLACAREFILRFYLNRS